jgi:hypothetical protein
MATPFAKTLFYPQITQITPISRGPEEPFQKNKILRVCSTSSSGEFATPTFWSGIGGLPTTAELPRLLKKVQVQGDTPQAE